jgi:hypothetical protein
MILALFCAAARLELVKRTMAKIFIPSENFKIIPLQTDIESLDLSKNHEIIFPK